MPAVSNTNLALDGDILRNIKASFLNPELEQIPSHSLCPYISSTFTDVEDEVKFLYSDTFPRLNDLCQRRGISFSPCDIRRTVIDARATAGNALQHALDAVTRCKPFFMCVIGDHYGRHEPHNAQSLNDDTPTSVGMNIMNASKWGHSWVSEPEFINSSIMELEVIEAALKTDNLPKYCFFYMRDFRKMFVRKTNDASIDAEEMAQDIDYIFNAESAFAEQKLTELKLKIVKKGFNIQFFENPDDLGEKVYENWSKIITHLYPLPKAPLNESHIQMQCAENAASRHRSLFYEHEKIVDLKTQLNQHIACFSNPVQDGNADTSTLNIQSEEDFLNAPKLGDGLFSTADEFLQSLRPDNKRQHNEFNKPIFALAGDPGTGKTALIANWLDQAKKEFPDLLIISEFIGCTSTSRDIGSFFRQCIRKIHSIHRKKRPTCMEILQDTENYADLVATFQQALTLVPCLLVMDSLSDLKASMDQDIGLIKKLRWLPEKIPSNCRIIITTRRSDLTFKSIKTRHNVQMILMPPLQHKQKITLLNQQLHKHTLKVSHQNMDKIMMNRLSEKPLYLLSLADLLNSCYDHYEVDQVIEKCTELKSFREFWKAVFNLWSRRFSWNTKSAGQPGSLRSRSVASGWVAEALRMIVSTRNGILEAEILHLLSLLGYRGRTAVTPYDWHVFQKAAKHTLAVGPTGLITFAHAEARYAVKFYLIGTPFPSATGPAATAGQFNLKKHYHFLLASYFLKYGTMKRKLTELSWQLEEAGDWTMLCQLLCKPSLFIEYRRNAMLFPSLHVDLIRCWKRLDKNGYLASSNLAVIFNRTSVPMDNETFGHHPSSVMTQSSRRLSTKLGMAHRSSLSGPALKRPSLIVTQFDEATMMSTTDESRSDTEEFSEAGSYSFFLTETDVDLSIRGWTPQENDPEILIETTILTDDARLDLRHQVAMFLHALNEEYSQESKQILTNLVADLEELRPLSTAQQEILFKSLCSLVTLSCDDENPLQIELTCNRALEMFNSMPLYLVPVVYMERLYTLDLASETYLTLSELCINRNAYNAADSIVKLAVDIIKQTESATVEARLAFVCSKLFMKQGMHTHAETFIQKAFTELLQWYGPTNLVLAPVLTEMGDLYALPHKANRQNYRRSLLSYKQALDIYNDKKKVVKAADVMKRIAILLKMEGTHRSKFEARECVESSLDIYLKEFGSNHHEIDSLNKLHKELNYDLKHEIFEHSQTKVADTRTDERPFSALSWHKRDLRKILKDRPQTAPPYLNKSLDDDTMSNYRSVQAVISPRACYSPYRVNSYANKVVVTPRPSSRAHHSPSTNRVIRDISNFALSQNYEEPPDKSIVDETIDLQSHTRETIKDTASVDLLAQRHITIAEDESDVPITFARDEDGNEVSVVVVPAGRQSRLSVKLEIDDKGNPPSRHHHNFNKVNLSGLPRFHQRSLSAASSRKTRSVMSFRSLPVPKQEVHRKHCVMPSGDNGISLTVHGSYSTLKDILPPPISPREAIRSTGIAHKSAWYNVPGRYVSKGEILPAKRIQIRPGSAHSSTYLSRPSTAFSRSGYSHKRSVHNI